MFSKGKLDLNLRDGTPVIARPLGGEDRQLLAEGFTQLSDESRYLRFWSRTMGGCMGKRMLDRFLDFRGGKHRMWGVFDTRLAFPGLGAASYWRFEESINHAEFSCTVLDRHQGRGVGTLLFALLWLDAFMSGIECFEGYVIPENEKAIGWMLSLGGDADWDGYKAIFRWELCQVSQLPITVAAGDFAEWLEELAPLFLSLIKEEE